jgi:exodeoxyribonuclease VII small subunit
MTARKKFKDFESALTRLEEITEELESGEKSLEESIELFTEGLDISKFCDEKLAEAEKKIKIITEKNGEFVEEDFESEVDVEEEEDAG